MPFRAVDHTADLAFEVVAPTLTALFQESARALLSVLVEHPEAIRTVKEREVELSASTLEDLLHDYLSEWIFLLDAYGEIYRPGEPVVRHSGEMWTVVDRLRGERLDPPLHGEGHHVKSVTYHGLTVERTPGQYRAFFILDV
jgi:SHS2 domain-containing protein